MEKFDPRRVEEEFPVPEFLREHAIELLVPIHMIESERMPNGSEMPPDLVMAARLYLGFHETGVREPVQHGVPRHRLYRSLPAAGRERGTDLPSLPFHPPHHKRAIHFLPAGETGLHHLAIYLLCPCEDDDPRCLKVQTMERAEPGIVLL